MCNVPWVKTHQLPSANSLTPIDSHVIRLCGKFVCQPDQQASSKTVFFLQNFFYFLRGITKHLMTVPMGKQWVLCPWDPQCSYNTRASFRDHLAVPKCRSNAGLRTFHASPTYLWNCLDDKLKTITHERNFKKFKGGNNFLQSNSDREHFTVSRTFWNVLQYIRIHFMCMLYYILTSSIF